MATFVTEEPPAAAETGVGLAPHAGIEAEAGVSTSTTSNAATQDKVDSKGRLMPSERLTGHQVFYVFIMDGFGGMAISAGVNFAIAYGE